MAETVALSGQSFASVWDGMTWPDYRELNQFWKRWPPPAISLAVMAHLAPGSGKGTPAEPEMSDEERAKHVAFLENLIQNEG